MHQYNELRHIIYININPDRVDNVDVCTWNISKVQQKTFIFSIVIIPSK